MSSLSSYLNFLNNTCEKFFPDVNRYVAADDILRRIGVYTFPVAPFGRLDADGVCGDYGGFVRLLLRIACLVGFRAVGIRQVYQPENRRRKGGQRYL